MNHTYDLYLELYATRFFLFAKLNLHEIEYKLVLNA